MAFNQRGPAWDEASSSVFHPEGYPGASDVPHAPAPDRAGAPDLRHHAGGVQGAKGDVGQQIGV